MIYFNRLNKGFLLLSLIYSCTGAEKKAVEPADSANHYQVSIQNPSISGLVKSYISENHIPAKKSVVFLSIRNDTESSTLYLSHTYNDISQGIKQPMGYAIVDSSLVLVYTSNYYFLLPKRLEEEISTTIRKHAIVLKKPIGLEHLESWHFTMCDGKLEKVKDDTSALQGIPCGYVIELDNKRGAHLRQVNK